MKNDIDELDLEILKYLEDDARKSLKKLADKLNKKTSTIYHRLQRLRANNVILGYSIIFNPEYLNIEIISLEKITVESLTINPLDKMFFKSFANYIKNEYPQVLFIALAESSKAIYLISIHMTEEEHEIFVKKLKDIPYIKSIETEYLSEIIKGQKLFDFNEKWIRKKKKKQKSKIVEEEEDEGSIELTFDEEIDELKF